MRPKRLLKEAKILLKKKSSRVAAEGKGEVEERIAELERAISRGAKKQVEKAAAALRKAVARHIPRTKREVIGEWVYSLGAAVLIALVIRHFAVEPFKIPSGSMIPTLEIGDKILVNKFIYGLRIPFTGIRLVEISKPQRWDVVVFSTRGIRDASQYPKNFVKRVVGLPGETIEIQDGEIYKYVPDGNGGEKAELVERPDGIPEIRYQNIEEGQKVRLEEWDYVKILGIRLPLKKGVPRQSTRGNWQYGIKGQKFTVREGCYFVLGDNTQSSFDSRGWGFVPFENVKGKVICKWSFLPPWGQGVVR
jgi:signal peptidase I